MLTFLGPLGPHVYPCASCSAPQEDLKPLLQVYHAQHPIFTFFAPHVAPCASCGAPQEDLKKIAPLWMNVSIAFKKDKDIDKAFGWVQEM